MKNLMLCLTIIASLTLSSCKEENNYDNPKEVVEVKKEVLVENNDKFEGLYYMEEIESGETSGPLEVIVNYEGKIEVYQASGANELRSRNFNDTFGTHPRIRFSGVVPQGDRFSFSKDENYQASDDLEEDGTNTNLGTGKFFTVYEFELKDGLLYLTIKIHDGSTTSSGGINSIVIERKFRSL